MNKSSVVLVSLTVKLYMQGAVIITPPNEDLFEGEYVFRYNLQEPKDYSLLLEEIDEEIAMVVSCTSSGTMFHRVKSPIWTIRYNKSLDLSCQEDQFQLEIENVGLSEVIEPSADMVIADAVKVISELNINISSEIREIYLITAWNLSYTRYDDDCDVNIDYLGRFEYNNSTVSHMNERAAEMIIKSLVRTKQQGQWYNISDTKPPRSRYIKTKIVNSLGDSQYSILLYNDDKWFDTEGNEVYQIPTHWSNDEC